VRRKKRESGADLGRLLELISAFAQQRIMVLGDLVADEFVTGEITRVSREAPVLILRKRKSETRPGGGANAANNIAALGAKAALVGVLGHDAAAKALVEQFRTAKMDVSGIVRAREVSTITKTRFLAGWTHTTPQQVLRVDQQDNAPLSEHLRQEVKRKAREEARRCSAVLLSDYGGGIVTPELVRELRGAQMTLDSRYALMDYSKLSIAAATPNEAELEAACHEPLDKDDAKLDRAAQRAVGALGVKALLVTRGKDGMVLYEAGEAPCRITPFGTEEAVDVTGAGDTVIAVFTLALVAGATFLEAAHLANYAGGIVVMKRGTATVTATELDAAVKTAAGSSS
jgi:rfaE bifunctional protein kinase chain/domain